MDLAWHAWGIGAALGWRLRWAGEMMVRECLVVCVLVFGFGVGEARAGGSLDVYENLVPIAIGLEHAIPDVGLEFKGDGSGVVLGLPVSAVMFSGEFVRLTATVEPQYSFLEHHWRLMASGRALVVPPGDVGLLVEGGLSAAPSGMVPMVGVGLTLVDLRSTGRSPVSGALSLIGRRIGFLDEPATHQITFDLQFAYNPFWESWYR